MKKMIAILVSFALLATGILVFTGCGKEKQEPPTENGGPAIPTPPDGGLIYCVLYEKNGYSYSIGSTAGLTWEQIEKMIP